jgi:hypothetical protein
MFTVVWTVPFNVWITSFNVIWVVMYTVVWTVPFNVWITSFNVIWVVLFSYLDCKV